MSPIEKFDPNITEVNSAENISASGGDGPLKATDTSAQKPRKVASVLNKQNIVKKIVSTNQGGTKIPRPPSSKETEKEINQSQQEQISIDVLEVKKSEEIKTLVSVARKSFRKRKSLSQMEIQRLKSNRYSRAVVPTSLALKAVSPRGETSVERSFRINDEYYCFTGGETESEIDAKVAGMKIFATIMLNAWRRRRDDVRRLNEEVTRLKKNSIRVKNQIHVLNSLFKIEQKQNDDLNCRLRRMLDDQKKIQDMYDELNLSFVELKSRNCLVEKELLIREKEYEGLNLVLSETKTQLFKCMSHERELETNLSSEQRKIQELENHKNELFNQLAQIKFDSCEKQIKFQEQISMKEEEMSKLKGLLDALDKKLIDLKIKESQVREYEKLDMTQRKAIEDLRGELNALHAELNNTVGCKMKALLQNIPEKSVQYAHLLMFYLLPAIPPPKIRNLPSPALEKAIGMIWKN